MMTRGSSRDSRPDLLKPLLVVVRRDQAEKPRRDIWSAVSAGLAFHENELDIILDYRIWLVGLTEKAGSRSEERRVGKECRL